MTNVECRRNDEGRIPKASEVAVRLFYYSFAGLFRHWSFACHAEAGRRRVLRHSHHLSHSPMTKSRLPSTAGTSLIMQPGSNSGKMLRFTNDGARILSRCGTPPPLLLM